MISTEQVVRRIDEAIHGAADTASALDAAADVLYRSRSYLWVGLYVVRGTEVVRVASRGPLNPSASFMLGEGYVGNVTKHGRPANIVDVRDDPTHTMRLQETRSAIVAPVIAGGRTVGVIDLQSDEAGAFGDEDVALIERVGELLAPILTNM